MTNNSIQSVHHFIPYALRAAEEHLTTVTKERSYYRIVWDVSKSAIRRCFQDDTFMPAPSGASVPPVDNTLVPPPSGAKLPPCSNDLVVHYSFDMALQHDPLQPGPVYFLTTRKCVIFGVCCKGLPRQINYLIDEASDTGKGANTIISMLHIFFAVHSFGETTVHLHADNCVVQNKNSTLLQYLMWNHGWPTPQH